MSKISRTTELLEEFGLIVMAAKLLQTLTRKVPIIKYKTGKIKYKAITDFLYDENKQLIKDFNCTYQDCKKYVNSAIGKDSNVWVLWWQGKDSAPDIVKMCFESIREHIGKRKLVVLDQFNYVDYVSIDKKYVDMIREEKITRTQFSDLLRLNLLYQNGGIWLDATYLLTADLDASIADLSFFTIRHGMEKKFPMSKGLWTSSALGFGKRSIELKLFLDIYDAYFAKHDALIDYLLTDYIFAVCCDHCDLVRSMFESVPMNNKNVNELLLAMNTTYNEEMINRITSGTTMNKLSWKYKFEIENKNRKTVYGYFLEKFSRGS